MTSPRVQDIIGLALLAPDALLVDETRDAQWADYGRMVHQRLVSPDLPEVVTRAGLKSKSTIEMVGYIRAFILTGAKP